MSENEKGPAFLPALSWCGIASSLFGLCDNLHGDFHDQQVLWDGDDIATMAVDDQYVHMVWGDLRAGFLGSWYARIPLASYQEGCR